MNLIKNIFKKVYGYEFDEKNFNVDEGIAYASLQYILNHYKTEEANREYYYYITRCGIMSCEALQDMKLNEPDDFSGLSPKAEIVLDIVKASANKTLSELKKEHPNEKPPLFRDVVVAMAGYLYCEKNIFEGMIKNDQRVYEFRKRMLNSRVGYSAAKSAFEMCNENYKNYIKEKTKVENQDKTRQI